SADACMDMGNKRSWIGAEPANALGQAIVGNVESRGEVSHRNRRNNPMHLHMHQALRCRARTRRGSPCQSPAMKNGRCRMHGGPSPGAPKGNQNALKHGRYTAQAMERRRGIATLLRAARALAHPDRADGRNANSHTQTGKGTKVICAQCGRPGGNQVASGDEIGPVWLHHECEASWIERRMGEEGIKLRQPDSPEKRGTSDISQAPQELPDIPVPEEASSQPPIRP